LESASQRMKTQSWSVNGCCALWYQHENEMEIIGSKRWKYRYVTEL